MSDQLLFLKDYKSSFITISIIFLIGLIHLPTPFFGDQAFFLLGAKEMDEGFVLYRDFWDIKQPAIFFFYLAAGKLFGFTEVGVHLFELIYWLFFSIILIWYLLKFNYFKYNGLAYLAPLMIVGTYYANSSVQSLTQVEALVNFPILMVLVFNHLYLKEQKNKLIWLFCSGVAGGIVIFFKFIFAPLLIAFWSYFFIISLRNKESIFFKELLNYLIIPIGVVTFWIPFLIYSNHHNIGQLCYYTFIKLPPIVLEYGRTKPLEQLFNSTKSFLSATILIAVLSSISLLFIKRKNELLPLWLWLFIGFIIVLLQKTSWYTYHFQLLYVPLILLALFTLDWIIQKYDFIIGYKYHFISFVIICIFINSISIIKITKKLIILSDYNFSLTRENVIKYSQTNIDNARAYRISSYLSKLDQSKCPIFVVNDPLVYYHANRNQATAQSGWSMQLFVPGQIDILFKELEDKSPCFIFIRREFISYFNTTGIKIYNWIAKNYQVANQSNDGIWYRLNYK